MIKVALFCEGRNDFIYDFFLFEKIYRKLGSFVYRWMRNPAEELDRLTVNAKLAKVLGSIPVSSETVETDGRQMKPC